MALDPAAWRRLAGSEFNARLSDDPELRRLSERSSDADRRAALLPLLELLGMAALKIGRLPVRPLTVARWALLWALGSPLATGRAEELDDLALDVALFVLSRWDLRRLDLAPDEIPAAASGLRRGPGLPLPAVAEELRAMVDAAFRPLLALPAPAASGPVRFDAAWAAETGAMAARESGMPLDYCLHVMPLSAVYNLLTARIRRLSPGPFGRMAPADPGISAAIDRRIMEIAADFLAEKRESDHAGSV